MNACSIIIILSNLKDGNSEDAKTMFDLVDVTTKAFYKQDRVILDNVFYSLQLAMMGILSTDGNNTYKLAHISKDKLRNEQKLLTTLPCCMKLLEEGKKFLAPHIIPPLLLAPPAAPDPRLLEVRVKKESLQDNINDLIQAL